MYLKAVAYLDNSTNNYAHCTTTSYQPEPNPQRFLAKIMRYTIFKQSDWMRKIFNQSKYLKIA